MKLYSIKDQIESLEKLVTIGLHSPITLKNYFENENYMPAYDGQILEI